MFHQVALTVALCFLASTYGETELLIEQRIETCSIWRCMRYNECQKLLDRTTDAESVRVNRCNPFIRSLVCCNHDLGKKSEADKKVKKSKKDFKTTFPIMLNKVLELLSSIKDKFNESGSKLGIDDGVEDAVDEMTDSFMEVENLVNSKEEKLVIDDEREEYHDPVPMVNITEYAGSKEELARDPDKMTGLDFGFSPRIINAELVLANGSSSYMVQLSFRKVGNEQYDISCAGFLISCRHIVTAAHCIRNELNQTRSIKQVLLGNWPHARGKEAPACTYAIHPTFNERYPSSDDIAVVILDGYCDLKRENLETLSLVDNDVTYSDLEGVIATVKGWGATSQTMLYSRNLRKTTLAVVPKSECFRTFGFKFRDDGTQLCAKGIDRSDTCNGDSGAPLTLPSLKTSKKIVIGLVLGGNPQCEDADKPSTITALAPYTDWIFEVAEKDYTKCDESFKTKRT